jgi:hypothetical protein
MAVDTSKLLLCSLFTSAAVAAMPQLVGVVSSKMKGEKKMLMPALHSVVGLGQVLQDSIVQFHNSENKGRRLVTMLLALGLRRRHF